MTQLDEKIAKVKDEATRDALAEISKFIKRIESVPPVTTDPASSGILRAINKITGKL